MGTQEISRLIRPIAPLFAVAALCGLGMPASAGTTLYDDLGGKAGMTAIIGGMVDSALVDDRIKAVFDNIKIPRLKGLLADHICTLTGGPCQYHRRSMKDTHAGLNLHDSDFNALVEDLEASMDACDIPWSTQVRLLAILAPIERDVVKQ
jgi:hemoglobin